MQAKFFPSLVIIIVVAVLSSMLVAHYDELLPHRWETYTAPDRSFSIELPGKPSVETAQIPFEGGGTVLANLITARTPSNVAYSCVYFANENVSDRTPNEVLDSARDESLHKIQGTVLSQKRITVQGQPGLEMEARARGNSLVDARLVVVGDRLYMIMAVATERDRDAKTVRRLFDSFKIN